MMLDKYPRAVEEPTVPLRATGCSSTAKASSDTSVTNEEKAKPGRAVQLQVKSNVQLKLNALLSGLRGSL